MNRITILIPAADGHALRSETVRSIAMQSIPCDVVVISRSQVDACHYRREEAINRNLLRRFSSSPYAVMMDTRKAFTSDHDVADMVAFLDAYPEWDAVALDTKGINIRKAEAAGHVDIGCMCVRTEKLQGFEWRIDRDQHECCCKDVNEKLKIRYLDDRKLIEFSRKGNV